VPARPPISDLPFDPASKPTLGFEMFKLSSLYARADRNVLTHRLEAPQRPEFHTIYVGTQGKGELIVDFTPTPIGAGSITVVARGRVQQFHARPKPNLDAWLLLCTPEFLEMPAQVLWPLDDVPSVTLDADEHRSVLEVVEQLAREQDRSIDRVQPQLLAALVHTILLRVERRLAWQQPMSSLRRFFTILERDYARTREVAHYARLAGISTRRLGEIVRAELGKSTKQIVDERVILEQKRLLAHTAISVKELADRTGFEEPTNLVKFFRHHVGLTPLEFRRRFLPSGRRS
jgi:AraC-like DNA-binding protein